MERREFLKSSAVAVAGLGTVPSCRAVEPKDIETAVRKVGTLPRRKLGGNGREITVLIGASSWSPDAVEAGVRCGVNFWHKAEDWAPSDVPPAIRKNRGAHYCQVCVDRVRGNHETGAIDEESHYQFVKQAVKRTGLGYFDDMQFHFGYHSVTELKNNRGMVRAYERLKKEGLVKHLCLSQHSYNGNWRTPGGQNCWEILTAVVEDGIYEHAQIIYSYGEGAAANEFLSLARRKGFGTIAMKTTRGASRMLQDKAFMKTFPAGTSPHHALARWLTTRSGLDAAVIHISGVDEFADTFSAAGKAMRASDAAAMDSMLAYANSEVCRLCNECMSHCGQGIAVADIMRYERYALDHGDLERARQLYAHLDRRGDSCTACGACLPHCPQGLSIPGKLGNVHALLA